MESHKFSLGRTVITPGALEALDPDDVLTAIRRHVRGDWGDCAPDDREENEFSVDKNLRLWSVFHDRHQTKFWIITEADRSSTTVLLPSEY
ncbi:MAG TPA: hypothetical protein VG944_16125 [Fimbriimonas sp.]|nr:hypothetical protein [Fimbriimonas sp.]